jgi:CheY-specific phosphatase CheX
MSEQLKEILRRVAEDVMEKLAFLLSFGSDESAQGDMFSAASISFSGSVKGTLIMAISDQILPQLAGNMLGLDDDEESTNEQQQDAVKELINVICGNLLPAISGKQHIFHIEPPHLLSEDIQAYIDALLLKDSNASLISVKLPLEDGECDLFLVHY